MRSGGQPVTGVPANWIVPPSGVSWPLIRLNSVVLPAPLGPMMDRISPSCERQADAGDGVDAAEAAGDALGMSRRTSYGPQHALRAEADQEQQHHAVDQHAVFGGDAEQLG